MQHTPPQDTTFQNQLLYPVWKKSVKNAKHREWKQISNVNQEPQLCTYLPKFTHLKSQDTPSQYQLS